MVRAKGLVRDMFVGMRHGNGHGDGPGSRLKGVLRAGRTKTAPVKLKRGLCICSTPFLAVRPAKV